MLQVMLDYAISLDLIAVNAAKNVEVIGRRAEDEKEIVPPNKEVMKELIGLASGDFKLVMTFAAATGVRAGELRALRWCNISFERREVRIEKRVDAYRDEDLPKTKAGKRTIPVGESLVTALRQWRLRTQFSGNDDLVFPNSVGTYFDHRNLVTRYFEPLFEDLAAKWKEERRSEKVARFNWHALRRFAISCWIDAGLPPKTVQTFAGHSSLQVTMDRYGHLFRSEGHSRVMDAISDEIWDATVPPVARSRTRVAKPDPSPQ